jgi:Tol biopolymer transport system component
MKKNLKGLMVLFLMAGVSLLFSGWILQESAKELFEKAVYLEETKGELEQAIDVYKRVVDEFPGDRATAARAQLQVGLCYEKLGIEEAEKAFQKVIDDYPDQTEAVKLAREKLFLLERARAIVEKEDQGIKMTEIPIDRGKYWFYTISPDGKKMANLSGKLDIWITDIASGKEAQITHTGVESWFSWAPDSQKLVSHDANRDLKVVSVQGGAPKTLIKSENVKKEYGDFLPTSWSPDCQNINGWFYKKGLFAIPVDGGEWKEIYKYSSPEDTETHGFPILSPNEKFLVYSDNTGNKDIYIVPAGGGEPAQITNHPAKDQGYQWSYDGRWLLFISSRSGKDEHWIIGITPDGKRGGDPFQIPLLSEASSSWLCWTKEGQIAFSYTKTVSNLFMSKADGSEEIQLTNMEWADYAPNWSPDGQSIAFRSDRGGKDAIWLMPAQGGQPRKISGRLTDRPGVLRINNLRWHPNGRILSCVVPRLDSEDRGMWTIDLESGLVQKIPFEFFNFVTGTHWSPDGKRLVFSFFHPHGVDQESINEAENAKSPNIYAISSEGGEAEILTKVEEDNLSCRSPRWSPDGKRIAFADDIGRIWVADSQGGDPQAITEAIMEKRIATRGGAWVVTWTPDGKHIIFFRTEEKKWACYSVPSQGGELRRKNIEASDDLDVSPDGKKVVYSKIMKRINQYWLIENFLPGKKSDK